MKHILLSALGLTCLSVAWGASADVQPVATSANTAAPAAAVSAVKTEVNAQAAQVGATSTAVEATATASPATQPQQAEAATQQMVTGAPDTAQPQQVTAAPNMAVTEAERNAQAGAAFLAANKLKDGVVTLPEGLQYQVMEAGTGARPGLDSVVTVDYEGAFIDGTVFDSSYKRGQSATFPLNGVIQGWQKGVQLMKEGATWMLFVPPELAYGERGVPGAIGPSQTLVFKVHLVSVQAPAQGKN